MALQSTVTSVPCPPILPFENGHMVERETCMARVNNFLNHSSNGTDEACMRRLFVAGSNTTTDNPYVTYYGCTVFCGDKQGWYSDPGPRVVDWVIPVFFLLSNIDLSPIDRRGFFAVIHALGDPIDTLWSLLDKLYAWYRCYQVAKEVIREEQDEEQDEERDEEVEKEHRIRAIATVFAGFEEIAGHAIKSERFYRTVARTLGRIGTSSESDEDFQQWRRAAVTIVDDRANEFLRTGLAITLYIFQVITEFVDSISGDPDSTPSGRIGSAMLLSWLIPTTLLSNVLGGFTSRRTVLETMIRLVEATNLYHEPRDDAEVLVQHVSWEQYFDELSSLGAIYTFRPFKARNMFLATGKERAARILILLVGALPVVLGFIPAFTIHWKANPNGFSCRHLWIIGVFTAWLFSAIITSLSHRWVKGNLHWWLVFMKDALVGLCSITMVFLSVVGMFNSCFCWSLKLWLDEAAYLPLNTYPLYFRYKKTIYPAIVAIFLGLQILLAFVVVFYFRNGLIVNCWGEKHKRKEWHSVIGKWGLQRGNLFLFWSFPKEDEEIASVI